MNLNLDLPINNVSFGQVSVNILLELYKRQLQPCIFPNGPVELQSYKLEPDFLKWLDSCIKKAPTSWKRQDPLFKLWHLNGSHTSSSNKTYLYSFYELDSPTQVELNITANQEKTIFSSKHAASVFADYGAANVCNIPLGFDALHFKQLNNKKLNDRITFNIVGKLERRKNHLKTIQAWIKRYGNDKRYALQCAIHNPFIPADQMKHLYNQITGGKNIFNVTFFDRMESNELYNEFLNSGDILLGLSGGEGWGLPEFHSVAIGKHAVMMDSPGYSDWITTENSVIIPPVGKSKAYDGMFFIEGLPFNQGNILYFDDDALIHGCELATQRVMSNPINQAGLDLQQKFTYTKTVDNILNIIK